jgi:hypothetical protein
MKSLVVQILGHFAAGMGLVAVVWLAGWGWLRVFSDGSEPAGDEATLAYPMGLIVVIVSAALILINPWLGVLGVVLGVTPWIVRRGRPPLRLASSLAVMLPVALALPFIVRFAFTLGLLYHGPTDELWGRPYGDMKFFAAGIHSFKVSIWPNYDLLVEGLRRGYASTSTRIVGAALLFVPGSDAFLFDAVTMPAFFLTSMCLGLAVLGGGSAGGTSGPASSGMLAWSWRLVVIPLLCLGSLAYPSWVVESPNAGFALPLVFPVFALARNRTIPVVRFVMLAGLIMVCVILTKVFLLIPFALVLSVALLSTRWHGLLENRRRYGVAAALVLAGIGGGFVYVLITYSWVLKILNVQFLPLRLVTDTGLDLPRALGVAADVLLAAGAWWAGAPIFLGSLSTLMVHWTIPSYTDISVGGSAVLIALAILREPRVRRWSGLAITLGAVALARSKWMRELTITDSHTLWTLCWTMSGSVMVVMASPRLAAFVMERGVRRTLAYGSALIALAVTLDAASVIRGVAAGRLETNHGKTGFNRPAEYDIYRTVRERTPHDALIFVKAGPFDYYMGTSERQFYLGSWYNSVLRTSEERLKERSDLNARVLRGELPPDRLPLSRKYSSYFAVVRWNDPVPAGWSVTYSNEALKLLQIPPGNSVPVR